MLVSTSTGIQHERGRRAGQNLLRQMPMVGFPEMRRGSVSLVTRPSTMRPPESQFAVDHYRVESFP